MLVCRERYARIVIVIINILMYMYYPYVHAISLTYGLYYIIIINISSSVFTHTYHITFVRALSPTSRARSLYFIDFAAFYASVLVKRLSRMS